MSFRDAQRRYDLQTPEYPEPTQAEIDLQDVREDFSGDLAGLHSLVEECMDRITANFHSEDCDDYRDLYAELDGIISQIVKRTDEIDPKGAAKRLAVKS